MAPSPQVGAFPGRWVTPCFSIWVPVVVKIHFMSCAVMIVARFCIYLYFHKVLKMLTHTDMTIQRREHKAHSHYRALPPLWRALLNGRWGSDGGWAVKGAGSCRDPYFHLDGTIWTRRNSKVV